MLFGLWEYIVSEIKVVPRTVYVVLLSFFLIGVVALFVWNSKKVSRCILWMFLGEYLTIIYGRTVIFRKVHPKASHFLTPFWSYNRILKGEDQPFLFEIILNVVLFIPVGLLLGLQLTKGTKKQRCLKAILVGMGLSLGIEVLQLVFKKGSFEVDDIIHNTLGCFIGFLLWQGIVKLTGRIKRVW